MAVIVAFGVTGAAAAVNGTTIWTLAGDGTSANTGDGGQAREASIDQPRSIFPLPGGGYVWAEPWSNRARMVDANGVISTLVGTGVAGDSGDGGPATQAEVNFVHSVAPTADGGFLVADTLNSRIRKIDAAGIIRTVAGTGSAGYSGDGGQATNAEINNPRGVVAMPDGGFLFPDTNNQVVRRVSPNGVITTVAGNGVQGFSGDGGQATSAKLSIPFGVAPTSDGGFLIDDVGNQRIRKVSPSGIIATVAGTGVKGSAGDGGPATSAQLNNPHNVVALSDGGFVIADASNERVRLVSGSGVISTLAGTGVRGFSGDGGPSTSAQVSVPKAVGVTPSGDILVAEEQNNRIRFIGTVVAPANTVVPTVTGTAVQGGSLTAAAGGWSGTGPVISYAWERCSPGCSTIAGATAKTYVPTGDDVGSTLRVTVSASNPSGSASASSAQTATIPGAVLPPTNVSPPTISGSAAQGSTLTVDEGSWSGATPITFGYQWSRCNASGSSCTSIGGATAKTYTVDAADVGGTLRARVDATNAAGSSDYAARVKASGALSYWRLADTNGTAVDERGLANGSYFGGPSQGVAGLLARDGNPAVSLDGATQYADVPANPVWTASPFSVEILVKPSVGAPSNKTIWSTIGPNFTGWWLSTNYLGIPRLTIGDGTAWRSDVSAPALSSGTTYHIVATYDGSQARLYLNGTLVSTGPVTTMAPDVEGSPMRFGAYSTGPGQFWPGVLDDASFYPTALSAAEVAAHYDASEYGSSALSAASAIVAGTAPVNTALPTISGAAQQGQTLTSTTGTWTGSTPITYTWQWRRCDTGGASCADIAGATGTAYALAAADVGATVRVRVTATNGAGSNTADSAATQVVTSAPSSPVNTSLPLVSGGAVSGQVLTTTDGAWTGTAPITYSRQWRRCDTGGANCANIAGATGSSYTVASADVGSTIRARVTATNASGSATADSAATAVVTAGSSSGSMTFSISAAGDDGDLALISPSSQGYPPSGSVSVNTSGSKITAGRRLAFGNYSVTVPLLRFDTSGLPDGATITSATLKLYVTKKVDGDNRSLQAEWYPGSSWPIDAADFALSSSGSALAGSDITGLSTGAVNSFALSGVSSVSTTGWTGLRLHVSGGQPAGDNYVQMAAFGNSNPVAQLVVIYSGGASSPPVSTGLPVVSGSVVSGQVLSVSDGSWSGSTPMSFGYQWRRCDASGGACVDVAGATGSSYAVVAGDVGSTLRAVVTASNGGGVVSATSAQTAVVTAGSSSGSMTFSISASGDDGDVTLYGPQSQGYPPSATPVANVGGSVVTAGRRLAFGDYEITVPLLRFDTSGLPDGATITSATLKVYVTRKTDTDDRLLTAEWVNAGSTWPIDSGDFTLTGSGTASVGNDITGLTVDAVNDLVLTGLSSVSTTGWTGLRLHVSGGQPAGDNYVQMAAFGNSNPVAQLVVTYTTG